jgi:hypothetical protein
MAFTIGECGLPAACRPHAGVTPRAWALPEPILEE